VFILDVSMIWVLGSAFRRPSRVRVIARDYTRKGDPVSGHFEIQILANVYASVIASHRTLLDLGLKPF